MTMLQFSTPHAKGYLEVSSPEGAAHEGETLQCCHCGMHFEVHPGSGTKRGFCFRCNAVTCGQKASCEECKPQEKVLEEIEAIERLRHLVLEQNAHADFDRQLERLKGR